MYRLLHAKTDRRLLSWGVTGPVPVLERPACICDYVSLQ